MTLRFDVAEMPRIDALPRTPQGGIIIPAAVTSTGVFPYLQSDGSTRHEYRSPAEVFHTDSLASLRAVPVTILHPDGPVTPDNFDDLAIGQADGLARQDGNKVAVDLSIHRKDGVDQVLSKDAREISSGYSIVYDATPGVTPDGERYDGQHTKIRYNHIAVGPQGWGRQGPDVRLRADSKDPAPCWGIQQPPTPREEKREMVILKLDGKDVEQFSEAHLAHVEAKADAAEVQFKADADAAQAKLDAVDAKLTEASAELETFKADAAAKLTAEKRAEIEAHVKELAPGLEVKADASDREVMLSALKVVRADFSDEGKSDEYVKAAFEFAAPRVDSNEQVLTAQNTDTAPAGRKDSIDLDALRIARDERSHAAHGSK